MAEFNIWEQETLAQFARDAQERMTQQDVEIEALRADLRTVLTAYRALLILTQPPSPCQNSSCHQAPAGR